MKKRCSKCNRVKSLHLFYRSFGAKDGYQNACKRCHYHAHHNSAAVRRSVLRKHGVTIEQYTSMVIDQNGCCAICLMPDPMGTNLCVDHDHSTGKIRGLLCRKCNAAIGFLDDSHERMMRALKHLGVDVEGNIKSITAAILALDQQVKTALGQ